MGLMVCIVYDDSVCMYSFHLLIRVAVFISGVMGLKILYLFYDSILRQ